MKLREARARKLFTVRDLAQQSGVSESTINKIEQGAWLPSLKTVRKLADILKVDPNEVEEFKAAIEKASK
jgi:transcriptional regulator with XRE-family HTH domain